jgi:hypothetical protein
MMIYTSQAIRFLFVRLLYILKENIRQIRFLNKKLVGRCRKKLVVTKHK